MAPTDAHQHQHQQVHNSPPHSASNSSTNLCIDSCGFYGTPENDGRCSLCYKKFCISKETASSRPISTCDVVLSSSYVCGRMSPSSSSLEATPVLAAKDAGASLTSSPSTSSTTDSASSSSDSILPSTGIMPIRCSSCRKRIGLTGFKCRCGDTFCSTHRYSDKHSCTFDYKAMARKEISANNPVVKAEKITKL
ncbi:hypothetical protein KP509_1Z032000 [Ceratopteris richardii]|nr:hypothetical protein KP509_1Z032000 [Ceratopteris richardii]